MPYFSNLYFVVCLFFPCTFSIIFFYFDLLFFFAFLSSLWKRKKEKFRVREPDRNQKFDYKINTCFAFVLWGDGSKRHIQATFYHCCAVVPPKTTYLKEKMFPSRELTCKNSPKHRSQQGNKRLSAWQRRQLRCCFRIVLGPPCKSYLLDILVQQTLFMYHM